jgi:hypothetical protein
VQSARGRQRDASDGAGFSLNDILIWVLVPVLSYLAGALFQAGYSHYFGLPDVLVSTDPVATFHASRRYLELIIYHFSYATAIPLAFLVYLALLSNAFYRNHAIVVMAMAAAALFVSFSIRPWVWALAAALALATIQLRPLLAQRLGRGAPPREPKPHLVVTSPVAVKTLVIVAFLYATLFAAGFESARYETEYFITDRDPRYVMLSVNDKDVVAAELLDPQCKRPHAVPPELRGYHFDRHIRVFTLGDTDTPPFRLYRTDGLTSSAACTERSPKAADLIWI